MKVCILTAGRFPVPVSQGGAVESLVDIIASNYQNGTFEFSLDIISIDSEKSCQLQSRFDKVQYIYHTSNKMLLNICERIMYRYKKLFSHEPFFLNRYLIKAVRTIKKNHYDVVIIENRPDYANYIKRHVSVPCVSHIHNDFLNASIPGSQTIVNHTDLFIAISDFINNKIQTLDVPPELVKTVHNVIDLQKFGEKRFSIDDRNKLRNDLGIAQDDIVCVFVGRLDSNKGVDKLIEAANKLKDEKIKIMIVGSSFYEASVETDFVRRIKKISDNIREKIIFTGYIDNEQLYKYYKLSDISITPSQWDEPAGLVVLEAQACGLPVIATRCGGIPEFLTEKSGILIDRCDDYVERLRDSILLLAKDANLRRLMGKNAIESVKRFDSQHYLEMIIGHIKTII